MCAGPRQPVVRRRWRRRPGTRFGPIRRFAEIDSTNRYLLDEARAGAAEGVVAVADYQSAGRGRLGRRWEAPPGSNLLVSVLLRPDPAPSTSSTSARWRVALAAAAACERGRAWWPSSSGPTTSWWGGASSEGSWPRPCQSPVPRRKPSRGPRGGGGARAQRRVGRPPTMVPTARPRRRRAGDRATRLSSATPAVLHGGHVDPAGVRDRARAVGPARAACSRTSRVGSWTWPSATGGDRLASEYRRRCATVGKDGACHAARRGLHRDGDRHHRRGPPHRRRGSLLRTVAAGDVVHLRDQG